MSGMRHCFRARRSMSDAEPGLCCGHVYGLTIPLALIAPFPPYMCLLQDRMSGAGPRGTAGFLYSYALSVINPGRGTCRVPSQVSLYKLHPVCGCVSDGECLDRIRKGEPV